MGQVWKQMFSSLDMKYVGALDRIRASVMRDNDELLCRVACRTALISVRLENVDGALLVKVKSSAANARSGTPAESLR